MDNKFLLLLVAIPIVLAGCIGQTPSAGGGVGGVIIQSFTPEFTEVTGDTPVTFTLLVKNTGGIIAENVKAQLSGLPWPSVNPDVGDKVSVTPSSLTAANPAQNIEGQEGLAEWDSESPKLANDITYNPTIRVFYDYSTVSENNIKIVGYQFSKTTNEKSRVESAQTTAGPFVITPKGNIPLKSSQNLIIIQFDIQNVGGGRAYKQDGSITEDLDYVDVSVEGASDCGGPVRLIAGKSRILSCKLDVSGIDSSETDTKSVKITLTYTYFIDSATSVKVLKTEELETTTTVTTTTTTTTLAPECSGTPRLTLTPTTAISGALVVPSVSGLSKCAGKSASFREDTHVGTQVSSCVIASSGDSCTGDSFTAPSANKKYVIWIDMNGNAALDTGEADEKTLTISTDNSPNSLSLVPNPAGVGASIKAVVVIKVVNKDKQVGVFDISGNKVVGTCTINDKGVCETSSFVGPSVTGNFDYQLFVDENKNGQKGTTETVLVTKTLKVV